MTINLFEQVSLFDFLDVEGRPISLIAFMLVLLVSKYQYRLGLQSVVEQYLVSTVIIKEFHKAATHSYLHFFKSSKYLWVISSVVQPKLDLMFNLKQMDPSYILNCLHKIG
jgi:hypothetical protein